MYHIVVLFFIVHFFILYLFFFFFFFFFSSRRRHTRCSRDWSSDVCSSDLYVTAEGFELEQAIHGPQVAFEKEDLLIPIAVKGPAQARMGDFLLASSEIGSPIWLLGEAPNAQTAELFNRDGWKRFAICDSIDVPEEVTPLVAALPVQLLSEFLASARGTNADSFRVDQEAYKKMGTRFR